MQGQQKFLYRSNSLRDALHKGSTGRVGRRLFGDLKVRPKLMILHNLFFVILASSIYLALYPYLPDRGKTSLFIVLGSIYVLAVLVLESTIMPLYVYHPLQLMLHADQATQRGDRDHELIDESAILGDEIGQIMRSRNATIVELRKREDDLEQALRKLEAQIGRAHV